MGGIGSPELGGANAAPFSVDNEAATKLCPRCSRVLPTTLFYQSANKTLYKTCKECLAKRAQDRRKHYSCFPRQVDQQGKVCTKCGVFKTPKEFHIRCTALDGLTSHCRSCVRLSVKVWKKENKSTINSIRRAKRADDRSDVILSYGARCSCCGETNKEFLAIDHINGGGKLHRASITIFGSGIYGWLKRNNYPKEDFRLLCHNCNSSLGMYGYCPHNTTFDFTNALTLNTEARRRRKLKCTVMLGYGGSCRCCGTKAIEFLTIHHTNNDGAQERREHYKADNYKFYRYLRDNNFPSEKYCCLCCSCNYALGLYGYCPHTHPHQQEAAL